MHALPKNKVITVPVWIEKGPDGKPYAKCKSPIYIDSDTMIRFCLEKDSPGAHFTGLKITPANATFGTVTIDPSKQVMTLEDFDPPDEPRIYNLVLEFVDDQGYAFTHDPEVINSPRK